MEMGDGSGMGGWVVALSMHCGRTLFARQSLFADQSPACMAILTAKTAVSENQANFRADLSDPVAM